MTPKRKPMNSPEPDDSIQSSFDLDYNGWVDTIAQQKLDQLTILLGDLNGPNLSKFNRDVKNKLRQRIAELQQYDCDYQIPITPHANNHICEIQIAANTILREMGHNPFVYPQGNRTDPFCKQVDELVEIQETTAKHRMIHHWTTVIPHITPHSEKQAIGPQWDKLISDM